MRARTRAGELADRILTTGIRSADVLEYLKPYESKPLDRTFVVEIVQRLQADVKRLTREIEQLKMKAALGGGGTSAGAQDDTRDVKGVKMIARRVNGLEKSALRGLSDSLRDRLGSGLVVIASESDGKVSLASSAPASSTVHRIAGASWTTLFTTRVGPSNVIT